MALVSATLIPAARSVCLAPSGRVPHRGGGGDARRKPGEYQAPSLSCGAPDAESIGRFAMNRCLSERALLRAHMAEATGAEHAHLRLCADCAERFDALVEDLHAID